MESHPEKSAPVRTRSQWLARTTLEMIQTPEILIALCPDPADNSVLCLIQSTIRHIQRNSIVGRKQAVQRRIKSVNQCC